MIKSLLILIEHVEQCLTVLTKMYNLLSRYTEHHNALPAIAPEDTMPSVKTLFTEIEDDDVLLTIADACDRMGVSRGTLNILRNQDLLPEIKKGKRGVRFRQADVDRLRKWYSIPKGKV